jgi:hypothetical protein
VNFEYVNEYYGVNACVGRRVVAYGKPGTIIKDFGNYVGIVLDEAPLDDPRRYHPIDGIVYGDVITYTPPKVPARKARSRGNYREYLHADYGHEFHVWLGIDKPRVDYDRDGNCRMYRIGGTWRPSIYGEWCETKKEAKASYKAALRASKGAHHE